MISLIYDYVEVVLPYGAGWLGPNDDKLICQVHKRKFRDHNSWVLYWLDLKIYFENPYA